MCIILLAENKQLTKGILEKAESANPHGAGIAWINDNTKTKDVKWIKGVNLDSKGILKLIKIRKIKTPYIVHFRIASIGSTSDQLCHPFDLNAKLNENKQSGNSDHGVLFHNGTMTDYMTHYDLIFEAGLKLSNDKGKFEDIQLELSDSRVMSYIANKDRLGLGYLEMIKNQKIAILTKEGIKTYGSFVELEKQKMSNDHGMRYNACENNFFGDSYDYNFGGFSTCYPKVIEHKEKKSNKFGTKQIIKQTELRIEELEKKLKSKKGKKEMRKIEKSLKKSKKRLDKELNKEIKRYENELKEIKKQDNKNALSSQKQITVYNGHGINCNCLKCYKSENLEIDQNRQRMENKFRVNQSTKIIALEKLEKDIIQRKFENKEIDIFNDLLDHEFIIDQIRILNPLTNEQTELIYNYLKSLTYDMFDQIFTCSLDNEMLKSELLERSRSYDFSNQWKNESRINGVMKW